MVELDPQYLPPNGKDWSIHDKKEDLVFPPIEHEDLEILSSDSDLSIPQAPAPPSSSNSHFNSHLRGWISISFHMLRSKISSFRNKGAFWSIGVPSAAVLLFSFWIIITFRKKRTLTPNETRLINIINDKDRKIAQLLHQIAQMNELLIARHKALAAKVVE